MAETLRSFSTNPIVGLLSRLATFLGLVIASSAVAIFLDVRSTQAESMKQINKELKSISEGVLVLKGESSVVNVKVNEIRERLRRVEDKVFQ